MKHLTLLLVAVASAIYTKEDHQKKSVTPHLSTALCTGFMQIVNLDLTSLDNSITVTLTHGIPKTVSLLIVEDKQEVGEGGSYPSTQADLSMIWHWAQENVHPSRTSTQLSLTKPFVSQHDVIHQNTCCPTFLLTTGGPWLTVMGAIFTDKVIVQCLTNLIWFSANTILNEQYCYHLVNILHSLGTGLGNLCVYYFSLKPQPFPGPQLHKPELYPHFFPSIHAFPDASGRRGDFKYVVPLVSEATCVIFWAETLETSLWAIVVKFVECYSKLTHDLLANAGAAPQLFYLVKVGMDEHNPNLGHLMMFVMEHLNGMMVYEGDLSKWLPTTYLEKVENFNAVAWKWVGLWRPS